MGTSTIHVLVRTDTPWGTMTDASHSAQWESVNLTRRVAAQVERRELLDRWEEAYGLDYFLFREAVKLGCEGKIESLASLDSRVKVTKGVARFLSEGYGDDDIILPTDDDDIFYPSVFQALDAFALPAVDMVIWDHHVWANGNTSIHRMRRFLETNNWAIRGRYLRTYGGHQRVMLEKHQEAHSAIGKRIGVIPEVAGVIGPDMFRAAGGHVPLTCPAFIDERHTHSVYYLHSGSISYLAHKMGKVDSVVETLRSLPLHPLFSLDTYNDLARGHNVKETAL